MTEDRVSNETLKLASDKGIEWEQELLLPESLGENKKQDNPTQAIFQKFLRETYEVHISIFNVDYFVEKVGDRYFKRDHDGKYEYSIKYRNISVCSSIGSSGWPTREPDLQYPTYETALEAGLQRAIKDLNFT